MNRYKEIQEANTNKLLKKQGVQGTALGEKWVNGKPTGEIAVIVFVQKKFSAKSIISPNTLTKFTANDLVPNQLDGIPTDVIEVGRITKQSFRTKIRPIKPGYSVGHGLITAGTIGGIFLDSQNDPVILSNNHVLADENKAKIGDLIYQPGPTDSKQDRRDIGWQEPIAGLPYIGNLKKFARMKKSNNTHDSAIATIHPRLIQSGLLDDTYPKINSRLTGFGEATIGMQVQKCGRTTGYTTGRVLGINASFSVEYDFGIARFDKCIAISAMSKGGDSGSIIQDMSGKAIGLLFAGSQKVTIANPINIIKDYYGLKLYSGIDDKTTEIIKPNDNWIIRKDGESEIQTTESEIKLTSTANSFSCIERPISSFKTIKCTINTGTDSGATWGPGLSIHWPNGYLKVNLRSNGSFGGYVNGSYNINIGKVRPNTDYDIRIRLDKDTYIGEIKDNGRWYVVLEVPTKLFQGHPTLIRIGKTDINGQLTSHHIKGSAGEFIIKNI